jgi:hypothetical protein
MIGDDSAESSIDGEIAALLQSEGILSKSTPALVPPKPKKAGEFDMDRSDDFEDGDEDDGNSQYLFNSSEMKELDSVDFLLPACLKLNKILTTRGYSPLHLTTSDVNIELRSISVFVIDSWAESLFSGVTELLERSNEQSSAVKDASITAWKNGMTQDVLESRITDLQHKLLDSENRERKVLEKTRQTVEQARSDAKSAQSGELVMKKKVKSLELLLEANERKLRQKDIELAKLTEKLRGAAIKERELSGKRSSALAKHRSSPDTSIVQDAISDENDNLREQNADLTKQVASLTAALRDAENDSIIQKSGVTSSGFAARSQDSDDEDSRNTSIRSAVGGNDDDDDDDDDEKEKENEEEKNIAKAMYNKIKSQARIIDQMAHRTEELTSQIANGEEATETYRTRLRELSDETENLRIELDARPSMKVWNKKCVEVKELESKLHDVVMMRGESSELMAWKKHLGTRERIKADRRNHELGLWILESLPKAVMKDCLEGACRELDINDLSEIVPSIAKLKAVVKAVPRMERFISTTCNYIFQRAGTGVPAKPTMEDVVPVLKRWYERQKKSEDLQVFYANVMAELARRESLLGSSKGDIPPASSANKAPAWTVDGAAVWSGTDKDPAASIKVIRDTIDFQIEVLRHKNSFKAAEEFIREYPETMINRMVSHVQYLFDIKTLEGFLPRMNQVYLFSGEMRNFINATKDQMKMAKSEPDGVVIAQLQRVVSKVAAV